MATFEKGILGPVSGGIGTVVGSSWRGITYLRSKSGRRKRAATEKQEQHKLKFKLVAQFLRPLNALLRITFAGGTPATGANNAFAYTMQHAVTGNPPDYVIDYPSVLISRGNLPNGLNPAAAIAGTQITFTWADNSGTGIASASDIPVMVIYCPAREQALILSSVGKRADLKANIDVATFKGLEVHTYLAFLSVDQKEKSDSFYTGKINVA